MYMLEVDNFESLMESWMAVMGFLEKPGTITCTVKKKKKKKKSEALHSCASFTPLSEESARAKGTLC